MKAHTFPPTDRELEITLHQFEEIQSLFDACLARPAIEQVMSHPLASRDYVTTVFYRPEWELKDACVAACGLDYTQAFPCAIDCAARILTDAMLGTLAVLDAEAA